MWNETNFLLKGFIDEVKGALTASSGSGGSSSNNDFSIIWGVSGGVFDGEVYAGPYASTDSMVIE